jgi:hypothetical protein
MKLGNPSGDRKDNGFVFLIVVEPDQIDVHYAVGLGLPALTANELTSLNRLAEEAYKSTSDMDQALISLVQAYDTVARNNYPPLQLPTPSPAPLLTAPVSGEPLNIVLLCCGLCLILIILFFVLWLVFQIGRRGLTSTARRSPNPWIGSPGRSMPRRTFPSGGRAPRRSFPSIGGIPRTRGGGGSGRSGRGN